MKTVLHHYYFYTDNATDAEAYRALKAQLKKTHAGKFFHVNAEGGTQSKHKHPGNKTEEVELETNFLFNNQWNEKGDGARRLFDWYEGIYYVNGHRNEKVKEGHWLEITPEMEALRRHTLTCGYCGKYVKDDEPHKWYCEKCLGSEYLKESDLKLLRLQPVADRDDRRHYITDKEKAEILPLWKEAQGLGTITREQRARSKNRQKVADLIPNAEKKAAKLIEHAKIETKALTWLLDHEINMIDNVIYYDHTERFCFGWRTPLTAEERSQLLDVLCEFPFDYDLKGGAS